MEALGRSAQPAELPAVQRPASGKEGWEVRESALGAVSSVPGEPPTWEGWEDAAVAPEKLGGYLREMRR